MWFPYAAPFYVARIAEMRPALIVLATAHYDRNSVAGVVVGAIVLIFMSDRRDRSLSSAIVAVAQEGFSDGRCRWRLGHGCCLVRQLRSIVRCQL